MNTECPSPAPPWVPAQVAGSEGEEEGEGAALTDEEGGVADSEEERGRGRGRGAGGRLVDDEAGSGMEEDEEDEAAEDEGYPAGPAQGHRKLGRPPGGRRPLGLSNRRR